MVIGHVLYEMVGILIINTLLTITRNMIGNLLKPPSKDLEKRPLFC